MDPTVKLSKDSDEAHCVLWIDDQHESVIMMLAGSI